jgi:1-acyl-sn-glycerol-3-phosphate acyltransferase
LREIFSILGLFFNITLFGGVLVGVGLIYPSRAFFAFITRHWARATLWIAGARVTVEGADRVTDGVPRFYMANHQSALDIPILLTALRGDVRFMAKRSLFLIPIFGWIMSRYHFAPINRTHARDTLRSLEAMLKRLKTNPVSFAVFPEGTRTRDGNLQPFRRGTMKIGRRSGMDIVPVTIHGAVDVYNRDRPWTLQPGNIRVVVSEPIPAREVAEMSSAELQDRVVQAIARELEKPLPGALPAVAGCATVEATS